MSFFTDTFEGDNGTTLSTYDADWVLVAGTAWADIQSDACNRSAYQDWAAYRYEGVAPPSADYDCECTVAIGGSGDASTGPMVRVDASGNGYLLRCTASEWRLVIVASGGPADYIGAAYDVSGVSADDPSEQPVTARIEVDGTTVNGYINGAETPNITGTDSTHSAAGYPGIGQWGADTGATLDTLVASSPDESEASAAGGGAYYQHYYLSVVT